MSIRPAFDTDFALLDVTKGRKALARWRKANPNTPVKLIIHATLDYQWGNDDGESIEFAIDIQHIEAT